VPQVRTVANDAVRVTAALNQGSMLKVAAPNSPVVADLEALAHSLINPGSAAALANGRRSGLHRIIHAFGLT
jgi:Flp pilus assembly CpaE family ATPase